MSSGATLELAASPPPASFPEPDDEPPDEPKDEPNDGVDPSNELIASMRALGTFGRANPFAAIDPPPIQFLGWVVVWFALMLALSVWSFRTREI